MEEYYSEYGTPRKSRRSLPMRLVDALVTLLSLGTALAMTCVFFVPYIDPARSRLLPLLGLVAPAVYTLTIALALYWIIRWRWFRATAMLGLVFIGFLRISLFYRPQFRRVYDERIAERGLFKVMTYNVRCFYDDRGGSSADEVARLIAEQKPDVVCLQEFNPRLVERSEAFAALGHDYQSALFGHQQALDLGYQMAILSRHRIIGSGVTLKPAASVWIDAAVNGDTVRIYSNHLRTTSINAADDAFLSSHRIITDSTRDERIRSMASRFRRNSVLRAAQADTIARDVAAFRGPKIVCGDFNDTPVSYVYNRMSRNLNDAFRECGSGYSHTYRGFFNMLRIDFVLSSDHFETVSYEVPEATLSDHLPVIVRLKRQNH